MGLILCISTGGDLYLYQHLKVSQKVSDLLSRHDFPTIVFKWHDSVKIVVLTVLVFCTLHDEALYLYQV